MAKPLVTLSSAGIETMMHPVQANFTQRFRFRCRLVRSMAGLYRLHWYCAGFLVVGCCAAFYFQLSVLFNMFRGEHVSVAHVTP